MNKEQQNPNKKKEKVLMLFSAALVLAALTMTGVHMRNVGIKSNQDQLSLPGESLQKEQERVLSQAKADTELLPFSVEENIPDSELDYLPEVDAEAVGSGNIEIPGVTTEIVKSFTEDVEKKKEELAAILAETEKLFHEEQPEPVPAVEEFPEEPLEESEVTLVMGEGQRLVRPVAGEVLIPFDTEHTVYFPTLDQYKYSRGQVLAAAEGEDVLCCSRARVTNIYQDTELGQVVELELGSGYQATYGQLRDLEVTVGQLVEAGQKLGVVAQPSKYYSVEGTNLYFALSKDGVSLNPDSLY